MILEIIAVLFVSLIATIIATIFVAMITLVILLFCMSVDCKFCKYLHLGLCKILQLKRNGEIVILIDYQEKTYVSLAHDIDGVSTKYSYVYATHKIGELLLYEDGTVADFYGNNTYIYNWLPYNVEDRTFMILKHDARVFELNNSAQ